MRTHIKILYGLFQTIAFIVLIVLIAVTSLVSDAKVGIDIGAFTIYSGAMLRIATASVREVNTKKGGDNG